VNCPRSPDWIDLAVLDGKVERIFVGDLIGLVSSGLLKRVGSAGRSLDQHHQLEGQQYHSFFLVLYYPERGLLAKYADLVSVEGSKITGCLRFGLDLYLWSPVEMGSFQAASGHLEAGLDVAEYRPLAEVTAFDIGASTSDFGPKPGAVHRYPGQVLALSEG
jgi:hypothetical protein